MKLVILLFLSTLFSCYQEQVYKGIDTHPHVNKFLGDVQTNEVFLFTVHGLNGQHYPNIEKGFQNELVKSGGASILSSYFKIIKKTIPNAIILDSGSSFNTQKTNIPLEKQITLMEKLHFDSINLVGNEANQLIKNYPIETGYKFPIHSGNLVNAANASFFNLSHNISNGFHLLIKDQFKVGVINLSDYQSLDRVTKNNLNGIYFRDKIAVFLELREKLLGNHVQAIIVVINTNTKCYNSSKNNKQKKNVELRCPKDDPLKEFIKRIPENTIDLIVNAGGTTGSGTILGIPIIKEKANGQYLGLAKMTLNAPGKNNVVIYPPLKTCHHFNSSTEDCHIERKNSEVKEARSKYFKSNANLIIPAKFLGHEITKDLQVEKELYRQ